MVKNAGRGKYDDLGPSLITVIIVYSALFGAAIYILESIS